MPEFHFPRFKEELQSAKVGFRHKVGTHANVPRAGDLASVRINTSMRENPSVFRKMTVPANEPSFQVGDGRSEEHTSELQSQFHLVCRLLLEKKKNTKKPTHQY